MKHPTYLVMEALTGILRGEKFRRHHPRELHARDARLRGADDKLQRKAGTNVRANWVDRVTTNSSDSPGTWVTHPTLSNREGRPGAFWRRHLLEEWRDFQYNLQG